MSTDSAEIRPARPGGGFATRLLLGQGLVLLAGALTTWLVASAIGPSIFHDHLRRAGVAHTQAETEHVEAAFTSALVISLGVALLASALMAFAVSWYFARRVQRSVSAVAESAAEIAQGRYGARVDGPALGEEFDRLTTTFNRLAERLDAVETTRRRMLADLAHEMRTPLATLTAHIEALEDGVRQPDAATIAVLRTSTERLDRLAQDISAVSRVEEGGLQIEAAPIEAARLTEEAVQAALEAYQAKGVDLTARAETRASVLVDSHRMGQVLGNLLDNALRHTPAGGSVSLTARQADPRWVELVVQDSGEGIEPEHLSHIFDRFYRADTARHRKHAGSGIGLTISRALVEGHGGGISAHSRGRNRGATFTVRLPIAQG